MAWSNIYTHIYMNTHDDVKTHIETQATSRNVEKIAYCIHCLCRCVQVISKSRAVR